MQYSSNVYIFKRSLLSLIPLHKSLFLVLHEPHDIKKDNYWTFVPIGPAVYLQLTNKVLLNNISRYWIRVAFRVMLFVNQLNFVKLISIMKQTVRHHVTQSCWSQ